MTEPKLQLKSLIKTYPGSEVRAVNEIDLTVAAGETLALLGPSGCGKSTTLNMIVGLEEPTSGDILIDGRSVVGVAPGKRNIGLVFQDYAVFTSMSVRQNLAFGLKVRGTPRAEIARAVDEVAELLGMSDRLNARARDLGGSEMQRVAIGRTLVTRPAILLLDEPLSNLESGARLAMRRELRRLQGEIGLTILYVTHDQIEALSLADRIAVMNAGSLRQVEASTRILERPAHTFVASFLGDPPMNLIQGSVSAGIFRNGDFALSLGEEMPDGRVTLGLRPQGVTLVPAGQGRLTARVSRAEPRGPEAVLTLMAGGHAVKVLVRTAQMPPVGTTVDLSFGPEALLFFDADTNMSRDLMPGPMEAAE